MSRDESMAGGSPRPSPLVQRDERVLRAAVGGQRPAGEAGAAEGVMALCLIRQSSQGVMRGGDALGSHHGA